MQKLKFLSIFLSLLAATLSHAQISYNCATSATTATSTLGLSGCLGHDFSQEEIDAWMQLDASYYLVMWHLQWRLYCQ